MAYLIDVLPLVGLTVLVSYLFLDFDVFYTTTSSAARAISKRAQHF